MEMKRHPTTQEKIAMRMANELAGVSKKDICTEFNRNFRTIQRAFNLTPYMNMKTNEIMIEELNKDYAIDEAYIILQERGIMGNTVQEQELVKKFKSDILISSLSAESSSLNKSENKPRMLENDKPPILVIRVLPTDKPLQVMKELSDYIKAYKIKPIEDESFTTPEIDESDSLVKDFYIPDYSMHRDENCLFPSLNVDSHLIVEPDKYWTQLFIKTFHVVNQYQIEEITDDFQDKFNGKIEIDIY